MQRRFLWILVFLFVVGCGLAWHTQHLPAVAPTSAAVAPALSQEAVPLATDNPAGDDQELEPLVARFGSHSIVALGEATHGTREFFRLKDRIIRALVRRAGFRTVALEISPHAGELVDRYIRDGSGDAKDVLHQFEFWTWQTEEFLELIQWMRAWNVEHPAAEMISFVGINATGAERDLHMSQNVEQALKAAGPNAHMVVWAHNDHVAADPGHMGDYLRRRFGDELYILGFEFSEGWFRSRNLRSLRSYHLPPAGHRYYAATLASLPAPILFLDFRQAARNPVLAAWLSEPRLSRDIDELFYMSQFSERWHSRLAAWATLYDGILFVRSTTAAHGLFANSLRSSTNANSR